MAATLTDKLIAAAEALAVDAGDHLAELDEVQIVNRRNTRAAWMHPAPKAGEFYHADARGGDVVTMPHRAMLRLAVLGYIEGVDPAALRAGLAEGRLDLTATEAPAPDTDTEPPAPTVDELEEAAAAALAEAEALTAAAGDAALTSDLTDEALAAMGAPDLVGHLTSFAGDAERIRANELGRAVSKRRKSVLAATGLEGDELDDALGK